MTVRFKATFKASLPKGSSLKLISASVGLGGVFAKVLCKDTLIKGISPPGPKIDKYLRQPNTVPRTTGFQKLMRYTGR